MVIAAAAVRIAVSGAGVEREGALYSVVRDTHTT
jgi:hypothetical protein